LALLVDERNPEVPSSNSLVDPKRTHLSDHYPEPREEVAKSLFCTVAEGPPGIIAYDVLDAQD
jgi:hypothetical protein